MVYRLGVDVGDIFIDLLLSDDTLEAGDELDFITLGDGGWGDHPAHDPALVVEEVIQGLVSVKGAREYGVVIAADGKVDAVATETFWTELRATRPAVLPSFNFEPSIANLRLAALSETGLPAPKPPRWADANLSSAFRSREP